MHTERAVPDTTVSSIVGWQDLNSLFLRFPTLRDQLNKIYCSTVDPTRRSRNGTDDGLYAESQSGRLDNPIGFGRGWTPEKGFEGGVQSLKTAIEARGPDSDGLQEFLRLFEENPGAGENSRF